MRNPSKLTDDHGSLHLSAWIYVTSPDIALLAWSLYTRNCQPLTMARARSFSKGGCSPNLYLLSAAFSNGNSTSSAKPSSNAYSSSGAQFISPDLPSRSTRAFTSVSSRVVPRGRTKSKNRLRDTHGVVTVCGIRLNKWRFSRHPLRKCGTCV